MTKQQREDYAGFSHYTRNTADFWAVIAILKLALLVGPQFIMAVLMHFAGQDLPLVIDRMESQRVERDGIIKRIAKSIFDNTGVKKYFNGVRIRETKVIPDYDQGEGGEVWQWIIENHPGLIHPDWKTFEKMVREGQVGPDCPIEYELETFASVNHEHLLNYHGEATPRLAAVASLDELIADSDWQELTQIYFDPAPVPIESAPQAGFVPMDADHMPIDSWATAPGATTVDGTLVEIPLTGPQSEGSVGDETPVEATIDVDVDTVKEVGKRLDALIDWHAKQTKSDDVDPDESELLADAIRQDDEFHKEQDPRLDTDLPF